MGRTAHEKLLPKQRMLFGLCDHCYADFKTAGCSLESYKMKSGEIKFLCHYCAINMISNIQPQPNTFEYASSNQ